eukprot:6641372-Pyramimonas_sp.AAC.1
MSWIFSYSRPSVASSSRPSLSTSSSASCLGGIPAARLKSAEMATGMHEWPRSTESKSEWTVLVLRVISQPPGPGKARQLWPTPVSATPMLGCVDCRHQIGPGSQRWRHPQPEGPRCADWSRHCGSRRDWAVNLVARYLRPVANSCY